MSRPKLLVVDGSSMLTTAYYAFMPNEMKFAKTDEEKEKYFSKLLHAPDGTYTNAVYGMCSQLARLLDGWKPDYLAVAFDKTRNTFRRGKYEGYKAQRKETQKPLKEQFVLMQDILSSSNIPVLVSDIYEADYLAGSLAEKYKETMQIRIVSKDRDYLQLVDDEHDVRLWVPASDKDIERFKEYTYLFTGDGLELPDYLKHMVEYTRDSVYMDKGVYPEQIPDLKSIEGDSSDNIPGVNGVSSATAGPLLSEYHTLEEIYSVIDACEGDKKKEKELCDFWKNKLLISRSPLNALKRDREQAFLSKDLATIRTYCSEAHDLDLEMLPLSQIDYDALNGQLEELGIKNVRFTKDAREKGEKHVNTSN